MPDEIIKAICTLLTHNDSESGDTLPEEGKLGAFEELISYVADQESERNMRDALQEVRSAVQVITISRPL